MARTMVRSARSGWPRGHRVGVRATLPTFAAARLGNVDSRRSTGGLEDDAAANLDGVVGEPLVEPT
ncbi:MAG: hypothetical protein QOF66_1331 [Mycobacterium sp.]|jgi:hypothetical protein|nr:hypothetical protein [Mycobacterium sp.]